MIDNFKLPIEYHSKQLSSIVISDLELETCYTHLFGTSLLKNKWIENYTTDKQFLMDSQSLIKSYDTPIIDLSEYNQMYDDFKSETNFIDKYQYIPFKSLLALNTSIPFMQLLSYYNLSAPVLSLVGPFFILILPFFIFKSKGLNISFSDYFKTLGEIMHNYNVFKIFDSNSNINQKISALVSVIFYCFQFYQNIISCTSFYVNMHSISGFIETYKEYLQKGLSLINYVKEQISSYSSYALFIDDLNYHMDNINICLKRINTILSGKNSLVKLSQIGNIMATYYELYHDDLFDMSFKYIYHLNEYNNDIHKLTTLLSSKTINPCNFTQNSSNIKKCYYLPYISTEHITNDISIKDNILITGPNASGKTTTIKSILINLIMGQQFGMGCYNKANVSIYDYFHSYLNIPDTSDRDSLFQAEARRCKDILQFITNNNDKKHFCIFDEIYSGTNPNDATKCAKIYLKGLSNLDNLKFIITTHYTDLCKYFDSNEKFKNIVNHHMDVIKDSDVLTYTYKYKQGISTVHGGEQILRDLDYPEYLFNL
jgi:hypothetical protein